MIENILQKHWRIFLLVGTILFALFLWPTPYTEMVIRNSSVSKPESANILRLNRITGTVQIYWIEDGKWRDFTSASLEAARNHLFK